MLKASALIVIALFLTFAAGCAKEESRVIVNETTTTESYPGASTDTTVTITEIPTTPVTDRTINDAQSTLPAPVEPPPASVRVTPTPPDPTETTTDTVVTTTVPTTT